MIESVSVMSNNTTTVGIRGVKELPLSSLSKPSIR